MFGGGQERKLRSGTENVQSIVGFGKACEISTQKLLSNQSEKLREVQKYAIDKITKEIPFSRLNGSKKERIPHNINLSFLGVNGEDLLIKLDENEIACSTGSACSANKKQKASHVLKALGIISSRGNRLDKVFNGAPKHKRRDGNHNNKIEGNNCRAKSFE